MSQEKTDILNGRSKESRRHEPTFNKLTSLMIQALEDTGHSNAELARRAGYDRTTVDDLMSGRRWGSLPTWSDLLEAAGIELDYALKG